MTQPQSPTPGEKVTYSLAALEAAMTAAVLAAYVAWLAVVHRVLFGSNDDGPVNPSLLWSTQHDWDRVVDALLPQLADIARIGWEDTMSHLGLDIAFDASDPIVMEQLQRTRNLLVRTPDEVYRDIIATLADAVNQGETLEQQRQRVSKILHVNGVENWPVRAQTVSVTEVNRALAFGSLAAGLRLQQTLPTLLKIWDSKLDSRVRVEHREADGQRRHVNELFDVGGWPMAAPLDPGAPPHLVINCRCKLTFELGAAR